MFKSYSIIEDVFGPVYGLPCWQVKKGIGSFLTMEFGDPRFSYVREPLQNPDAASGGLDNYRARRVVRIGGAWHLWIYCCDWIYSEEGCYFDDSDGDVREVARRLDGQKLTAVLVNPTEGASSFSFDLGGRLQTTPQPGGGSQGELFPHDTDDEFDQQWNLFEPSGDVLTYRADGKYSRCPGDVPPQNETWENFA